MLGREKRQAPNAEGRPSPSAGTRGPAASVVPTVITASIDAASQAEMLLRTKSASHSSGSESSPQRTTFLASSENGILVTSSRAEDSPLRSTEKMGSRSQYSSFGTKDASTLPTFLSVGESIDWPYARQGYQEGVRRFLASKEESAAEDEPHLLKLESLEANNSVISVNLDNETRKKLHYKEKLRALTDRLTTSSAVERSKKMLSNIMESNEGHDVANENGGAQEGANESESKCKRIFDGIRNKLYACSMRICVDEAVVDHEGLIITVPHSGRGGAPDGASLGCEDENASEISSLTGLTHHRYQQRYWVNYSEKEVVWV